MPVAAGRRLFSYQRPRSTGAQIAMAIVFGAEKSPFSDAAQLAIEWGTRHYINPAWRVVYEQDTLAGRNPRYPGAARMSAPGAALHGSYRRSRTSARPWPARGNEGESSDP